MSISTHNIKEKFLDNLKDYCAFAKEHDYMTVTEWHNGEGFNVEICSKGMGTRTIQLTLGEFEALSTLVNFRGEK